MSIIDEFDQELRKAVLSFEEKDKPADLLYHYKGFERSKDIISKNEFELNLTCYKYLQKKEDPNELAFSNSIINELIGLRGEIKYFWFYFSREFPKMLAHQSVYVRSFSYAHNDSHLFEKFAEKKTGCSFGFDFGQIQPEINTINPSETRYLLKVLYEKDVDVFKERINILLDLADQYCSKIPESMMLEASELFAVYLTLFFPVLKKDEYVDEHGIVKEFSKEKEYRHVMPGIIGVNGSRYPFPLDETRFRGEVLKESHYADILEKNILKEILIGSQADACCMQEMINLLDNHEYIIKNINIDRSKL